MNLEKIMEVDEYFRGQELSKGLFEALARLIDKIGPAQMLVTRSQISFRRHKSFAWVWMPSRYLRGKVAPLVLTLVFPYREKSPRWKEIVEPSPGHFTHHLEIYSINDIDDQVCEWLREAWANSA